MDHHTSSKSSPALMPMPHPSQETEEQTLDRLKIFLATAPAEWKPEQKIKRFVFPNGDRVSCILWNSLFHVTGTDIVKILAFRFAAFGRPIINIRKFEEGVFSDLRNLKPGVDATLEESKSDLLAFLHENRCIRTQKKQKVFYWFSVPHDRLFMDALERDLKREALGLVPTSQSKDKLDLNVTLEMAKSHCKPLIDMSVFEPVGNLLAEQAGSMSELSHSLVMANPEAQQSTYQELAQILAPSSTDTNSSIPALVSSTAQSFYGAPIQHIEDTPSSDLMARSSISYGSSAYDFGAHAATESDVSSTDGDDKASNSAKRFYKCEEPNCGRSFKRFQHLQRHMLCHTGERPFVCTFPNCGKSFSRADNLSVHQKRHGPAGYKDEHGAAASRHSMMPMYGDAKLSYGAQQQDAKSPLFPMPPFRFDSASSGAGNFAPAPFRPLNFGAQPPSLNYGLLASPKGSSLYQYAFSNGDQNGGYSYSFV